VHVTRVQATDFRPYRALDCSFEPGVTAIVGPNGAGKTSLLEAVHFGCLGWTPRTSDEARVVREGAPLTRVEVEAVGPDAPLTVAVGFEPGRPKRITVDGAAQRSADRLAELFAILVFTPDRLALVKGAPALRRSAFDRTVARLWPRYGRIASDYARALHQRNQLLRRVRAGATGPESLATWEEQLALLGAEIRAARERLVERLGPPFARSLEALGADPGEQPLAYRASGPSDAAGLAGELARRRAGDVERLQTTEGPHLDDFRFQDRRRDVRAYGSQGEQRTVVLALLLAEAELVAEVRGFSPLLLLDDVASELDADRRRRLLGAVAEHGQALVTTTDEEDLAGLASSLVRVGAGEAVRG
jgi:DNA replication and repair protein RecF